LLCILGTFLFWVTEHKNCTFSHLSWGDQFVNYFFLSVTPRTAWYAIVDYANLSLGSLFLSTLFMFIVASSGSTGGGIKVTTLFVILLVIYRSINYNHSNVLKSIHFIRHNSSFILYLFIRDVHCKSGDFYPIKYGNHSRWFWDR